MFNMNTNEYEREIFCEIMFLLVYVNKKSIKYETICIESILDEESEEVRITEDITILSRTSIGQWNIITRSRSTTSFSIENGSTN